MSKDNGLSKPDMVNIQKIYGLYQLYWMLTHNKSLDDLISSFEKYHLEDASDYLGPEDWGMNYNLARAYNDWEFNYGFDGEIWTSFEEFLESEFLIRGYITEIIGTQPGNNKLLDWYLNFQDRHRDWDWK